MKKKIYEPPECQVILFEATDIIATSGLVSVTKNALEKVAEGSAATVGVANQPDIPNGNNQPN